MTYRAKPITQRDGSALANSNCRCASGATGIDYDTSGDQTSTGKAMRSYMSDQSGGTSSSDIDEAWHRGYDNNVGVGDGGSFDDVLEKLREGRLVHLDIWAATTGSAGGAMCLSGSGGYGHTIAVAPEQSGSKWLVADPWCSPAKWAYVEESKLRAGAEEWGSQVFRATAGEPDWDDASPAERLIILARVVRRLMSRARPGNEHPEDETGGSDGPVLFTYTAAQEVDTMPKLYNAGGRYLRFKAGTHLYDRPGGERVGEVSQNSADGTVYHIVAQEAGSSPKWYLIDGGGLGNLMRWVKIG